MKKINLLLSFVCLLIVILFAASALVNSSKSTGSYVARPPKAVPMKISQYAEAPSYFFDDCYDSDGGKNFFVPGRTVIGNKYWDDYCDEFGRLVESFCMYGVKDSPQRGFVIYECPNGCYRGACRKQFLM
jgi:hypothetical protein